MSAVSPACGRALAGQQAEVALPGDVEGVAVAAADRVARLFAAERGSAVRAAQQREHFVERGHPRSLAHRYPSSQRRPCSTTRSGAKRVDSRMNPRWPAITRVHSPARSTQPPAANQ